MKRKAPKKRSEKGKLITEVDKAFRKYILSKRPHVCEWCQKPDKQVYICHILPKGTFPKLRYAEENILLLDYYCHMIRWHRNPLEASEFLERYKGQDYKARLLALNEIAPKMTMFRLNALKWYFEKRGRS